MKDTKFARKIISIGLILFFLAGCNAGTAPTSTPVPPTSTLTLTPTSTPKPTATITPSVTPTFTSTPEPLRVEELNAQVADIVLEGGIQQYVRCSLDAAVWGSYDITVTVSSSYTKDKKAQFFSIDHGVFTNGIASKAPSYSASSEGTGVVNIDDQTTAFELGIPFFITDVTYDGKSKLNFTVVTSPKNTIDHASMVLQEFNASSYSFTFSPFTPSSKPQKLEFDLGDKELKTGMYLAILRQISHTDGLCLLSNQVDLGSLKSP